jgi:hypothetical protein
VRSMGRCGQHQVRLWLPFFLFITHLFLMTWIQMLTLPLSHRNVSRRSCLDTPPAPPPSLPPNSSQRSRLGHYALTKLRHHWQPLMATQCLPFTTPTIPHQLHRDVVPSLPVILPLRCPAEVVQVPCSVSPAGFVKCPT